MMASAATTARHVLLDIPADRLARLVGAMDRPALLEGGPGFGAAGRWSHYTADPVLTFEFNGHSWTVDHGRSNVEIGSSDPLAALGGLLDRFGLAEKTLVIFCSDNGPVMDDGYKDLALEKRGSHRPAGPYRGGKYSVYEGGTRTPLITRWKGRIKPGVSDQVVCTIDFASSFAAIAVRAAGSSAVTSLWIW